MGMGDNPTPFRPTYRTLRDDVIGREFAAISMRSCPHPAVIRAYGVGGVANVSVYTCERCKYKTEYGFHSGLGCGYGLDKSI